MCSKPLSKKQIGVGIRIVVKRVGVKEAAKLMRVSVRTIYRWLKY